MKKGISIEFDYSDDGYNIMKAKGTLTLDEIKDAIREHGDAGRFLLMFDVDDDPSQFGDWAEGQNGDFAKAYSLTAIENMYKTKGR